MAANWREAAKMNAHIAPALRPLVERLRARYPGVLVVEAQYTTTHDGVKQQSVRFVAPIELLQHYDLVTQRMVEGRTGSITPIGDGFNLCEGRLDDLSIPGCWNLSLFIGASPRERPRISIRDAAKVLKHFTLSRRGRGKQVDQVR